MMMKNKLLFASYMVLAAAAAGQTKISELPAMPGSTAAGADVLPIVDSSAGDAGSKKITLAELFSTPVPWNGPVIAADKGGTGVDNTGRTITLGGSLTTTGANTLTLGTTGATSVTLPTSGTLATQAAVEARLATDDVGTLRGLRNLIQLPDGALQTDVVMIGDSFNLGLFNGLDKLTLVRGSYRCGQYTGGGDSGATSVTGDYTKSPDGRYWTITSGGNLTCGYLESGQKGPADAAHYTLFPGTGTAQMQYSTDSTGWTNVGSAINTSSITSAQVGSVALPSFRTDYRLRMTVSGGTVNGWIGMSHQGPGLRTINFSLQGQDVGQSASVPQAIWQAMITGYSADLVMTTFADHRFTSIAGVYPKGTEAWSDGGPLDNFRTWSRNVNPSIDWLVVGAHRVDPALTDPVDATIDPLFAALGIGRNIDERVRDGVQQARAWALRKGEGFYDSYTLFPSYQEAHGAGLYASITPAVTGISRSGNTVSVTMAGGHAAMVPGDSRNATITGITGFTGTNPNGRWLMTASSTTVLQYTVSGAAGTYGGSPSISIEDGIHLTLKGKQFNATALADRTNLGRYFGNTATRVGDMVLSATRIHFGAAALAAYNFSDSYIPTLGYMMARQFRASIGDNEAEGIGFRATGSSIGEFYTWSASAENPTQQLYGTTFRPANTTAPGTVSAVSMLGDATRRYGDVTTCGVKVGFQTKTAAYALTATDHTILCTGSGGWTITVPVSFSGNDIASAGRQYVVMNKSSGNITLAASSDGSTLQKIDNATTLVIPAGTTVRIVSTGTQSSGDYANWLTW